MKANVLLIRPRPTQWDDTDRRRSSFPIGILSIAGVLRQHGISVEILDFHTVEPENDDLMLQQIVENGNLRLVGFSVMSTHVRHCLALLKRIKAARPHVRSILGGIHTTLYPEQTCEHPSVDYVCQGDGEFTMLELVRHLLDGQGTESEIEGLVWKTNDHVATNPRRPLHDLDDLPYSPYELLEINDYVWRPSDPYDPNSLSRYFELHTGQGCVYRCSFCINCLPQLYNRRYRGKSAARILDEIEYLINTFQAETIQFVDELFFLNRTRLRLFLDGIRERKLRFKWKATARANFFTDTYINRDLVMELEELGCAELGFGTESGSKRVLDFMKKDISIDQVIRAAKTLAGTKILGATSFMIGLPTETPEEIKETFVLMEKLTEINSNLYYYGPNIFRPYPGSPLHRMCLDLGFREPQSLEEWADDSKAATGFVDVEKCVWFSDPGSLAPLAFYGKFAYVDLKPSAGLVAVWTQKLFKPIARWRVKNLILTFPIEYIVIERLKPYLRKWLFRSLAKARAKSMAENKPD